VWRGRPRPHFQLAPEFIDRDAEFSSAPRHAGGGARTTQAFSVPAKGVGGNRDGAAAALDQPDDQRDDAPEDGEG
jgi:hypothetical protein